MWFSPLGITAGEGALKMPIPRTHRARGLNHPDSGGARAPVFISFLGVFTRRRWTQANHTLALIYVGQQDIQLTKRLSGKNRKAHHVLYVQLCMSAVPWGPCMRLCVHPHTEPQRKRESKLQHIVLIWGRSTRLPETPLENRMLLQGIRTTCVQNTC